jgi:hypothetical protein
MIINNEEISSFQHECENENYIVRCVEYRWDLGKLYLKIQDGNPYEDGYSNGFIVNFCPFCGYSPLAK